MNSFEKESNRQIIPRWLPLERACKLIPTQTQDSEITSRLAPSHQLESRRRDWGMHRGLPYAIDLVAAAYLSGTELDDTIRLAAKSIVDSPARVTDTIRDIASMMLGGQSLSALEFEPLRAEGVRYRIRSLKKSALVAPRNSFIQLDLALYYTMLSQTAKASECIERALYLGSSHPIVLRAAARFYLHAESDPERSLHILRNSGISRRNPLVTSAEVAISQANNLKSNLLGWAKRNLSSFDVHPWFLAELAGSIATWELLHGSRKKGKKALALATACPDENTYAQMQWLALISGQSIDLAESSRPLCTFEADTCSLMEKFSYREALASALNWMSFQPFAERPAVAASYIASVCLEDYERTIRIIDYGRQACPDSFSLNNNLAFALGSLGRVEEAETAFRRIRLEAVGRYEYGVALATAGLLLFRSGDETQGRQKYQAAVSLFDKLGDKSRSALAHLYWAREEKEARTFYWQEVALQALGKAKKGVQLPKDDLLRNLKTGLPK